VDTTARRYKPIHGRDDPRAITTSDITFSYNQQSATDMFVNKTPSGDSHAN